MKLTLNIILLLIISFFTYFFVWLRHTPYPLQLNWDIYEHITLANKISEGHLSFFTSKISDTFTFDSYSPLFHLLLAVPKILLQADLFEVYYYLQYFYFTLTIIATFFLAKKIFQNIWVALAAGIFSTFIFENFMAYTSFFLIPQNLAALLTILALIYISKDKINKFLFGVLLLIIFLTHYIIGTAGIFIILTYMLARKVSPNVLNGGIVLSTFILFLLLGLNYLGNFRLTSREEALHFMFPLQEKLGFLLDWYSLSPLLLPLSYYYIFKDGGREQKAILILTLLTLGLSFAPFSYFLKFFVFDHYFLSMLLASGLGVLILKLPALAKTLAIAWISFCLLIVFFKSQAAYKEPIFFEGLASHISYGEIAASEWLAKNAGKETLLVSDPGTQYILEAVSGVNSQGGAFMSFETRKTLSGIENLQNVNELKAKLSGIEDNLDIENKERKATLLVLSGRYFAWQKLPQDQKLSSYYNIWQPQRLFREDQVYINFLTADPRVKVIYQNDELVIVQI